MDSQLTKTGILSISCLFLSFIFFSFPCYSGEIDIDMFGLAYHLHKEGAVRSAPLKLDDAGIIVLTPGIGLGYDFRKDRHTSGFSPQVQAGFFTNCSFHPFTFAGAGLRYRKYFTKKSFWSVNVLGLVTYNNDPDRKRYGWAFQPYANFGIGHDYGKFSIMYYISYVPKDNGNSITSDTDLLFIGTAVAF